MTLLSNADPIDADNPFQQQQDSVENVHPGFFKSLATGLMSSITTDVAGLEHAQNSLGILNHRVPFSNFQNVPSAINIAPAIGTLETKKQQKAELDELDQKVNAYNVLKSHEQGLASGAADFLGSALDPFFLAAGAATAGGADVGIMLGRSLLPEIMSGAATRIGSTAAGRFALEQLPGAIKGGAFMAGGSLPADVEANYNASTDSIRWGGVAKQVGQNFGVGMALEPLFPVLGSLYRKMKRAKIIREEAKRAKASEISQAEQSNVLTSDEADFLRAYNNKASTEELQVRAKDWLYKNKPEALDWEGNYQVKLITGDQLHTINSDILHEMANEIPFPKKTPLSDLIVKSQLATVTKDPFAIDTLQAFINHAQEQATFFDKSLDTVVRDVKKSVKNLPRNSMKYSQEEIFEQTKDMINRKQFPGVIPENVKEKLRHYDKIKRYNKQLNRKDISKKNKKKFVKRSEEDIKRTKEQLKAVRFMSYHDELNEIKQKLFKDGELIDNHQASYYYHRLQGMIVDGQKSKQARILAAQVRLHADRNEQLAFARVGQHIIETANLSPLKNEPDANSAIDYVREQILSKQESVGQAEVKKVHQDYDNRPPPPVDEIKNKEIFKESDSEELANQANSLIRQHAEMKRAKPIFDQLNACMVQKADE